MKKLYLLFKLSKFYLKININKYADYQYNDQLLDEKSENDTSYIYTPNDSLNCWISSNDSINCIVVESTKPNSSFEILNLYEFSGSYCQINSITIKDLNKSILGQTREVFKKDYSNKFLLLGDTLLFITADPSYALEQATYYNSIINGYLYINFELPENMTLKDNITIYSIFSDSESQ